MCDSHIGGKALTHEMLRVDSYWPTQTNDNIKFVIRFDKCPKHANLHHVTSDILYSITLPCPFYQWGVDILGPSPQAQQPLKSLIIGLNYFTKWIKDEVVSKITADNVCRFYWQWIICNLGLLGVIILDNVTQFYGSTVVDFSQYLGIKNNFILVVHQEVSEKTESENRLIWEE